MLRIFNTLTRKKEIFKPLRDKKVLFYHCGPTVYWTQHIGNLRGMTCADTIVRSLEYLGYKVILTRNYTDVGHLISDADEGEDKMEKSAQREGISPKQIAEKYIKIFEKDIKELNIRQANYRPRATRMIPEIIKMIQTLLKKGFAYSTPLAIYFDISRAKNYYRLSGQKGANNLKNAGKGEVSDPNKKNAADFALWFFKAGKHKNALQTWPSPFKSPLVENGQGFPGWHIECSAMAKKFLGKTIDIHMGGVEHIPIHHTNEIAQSEAANGVKFVNYWLHNEHLMFNGQKMAKSTGLALSLSEVKEKGFNPLALRYLFLQAHYRSKQNFTWKSMEASQKGFDRLVSEIQRLGAKRGAVNSVFKKKFIEKISDDFNIPGALAILHRLLKTAGISYPDKLATVLDFDKVLGFNLAKVIKKNSRLKIPSKILMMAKKREKFRKEKEWQKADELRRKIEELGYKLEDTEEGTKIKPIIY